MSAIRAYPLTDDFRNLLDDFKNFNKIAEHWETTQNIINLQKNKIFQNSPHTMQGKKLSFYKL